MLETAESRAGSLLHPMRVRILDALREPGSATTVARQLGLARQKVNYHLRELEKAGYLEEVEERRAGNCIERIVRARAEDRFSSASLIALAAGVMRDVAAAQRKATTTKKRVATFALQTDVRFATAEDRRAFIEELANAVARLVAKYHDDETAGGRTMRFVVGAYPRVKEQTR